MTWKPKIQTGYIIDEVDELKLRTRAKATRGIARLVESEHDGTFLPEIQTEEMAAIFFTIADGMEDVLDRAEFRHFDN